MPGRRIVHDQNSRGGQALPWLDLAAFCAPPSPQIYLQDADRRHGLAAAEREFVRLQRVYPALGYTVSRSCPSSVSHSGRIVS